MYWYRYIYIDKKFSKIERSKKLHIEATNLLEEKLIEKFHFKKKDLNYKYGLRGKPYLEKSPFNFSISHCNEVVVCGVSRNRIGIDIEDIKSINKYVIKKALTESEEKIMSLYNEKEEYFFRIWSLKEAFIKSIGYGLSYGMRNIEFNINNREGKIYCNISGFKFRQEKIKVNNKEYIISVAWEACNG